MTRRRRRVLPCQAFFCAYLLPGSLFPFALNASPKGFRAPPPAGFWWHAPHAFPVWAANSGFASADRGVAIARVPQTPTAVAITVKILKFIVSSVGGKATTILISRRLLDFDQPQRSKLGNGVTMANGCVRMVGILDWPPGRVWVMIYGSELFIQYRPLLFPPEH